MNILSAGIANTIVIMLFKMKCDVLGVQRLPTLYLRVVTFAIAVTPLTSGFSLRSDVNINGNRSGVHVFARETCSGKEDGYHTDTTCTNYWLCKAGKTLLQRACFEGTLFNGLMCVPAALVTNCAASNLQEEASSIECTGLKNGLHRNYYIRGCSNYVMCENGNAVLKGKCDNNLIFDGNICIEKTSPDKKSICQFENNNTEDEMECPNHKMSGVYTSANCQYYYYCNNALGIKSQLYECATGFTFNVNLQKCVPGSNCSSTAISDQDEPELDFCFDKRDGYYQDPLASGCRSYVFCNIGKKIIYLCPEGYAFDGTSCQVDSSFTCPYWSRDCVGKPNGYFADSMTGCRQYYYCLNGNKVMTLTCSKSRIFDGSKCIPRAPNICAGAINNKKICEGKNNGKYVIPGSNCQNFVICHSSKQIAHGSCTEGFVFVQGECIRKNGSVSCYTNETNCKENGIYGNLNSKNCTGYFHCVNGHKTDFTCPEKFVFNGSSCVDSSSYDCIDNKS